MRTFVRTFAIEAAATTAVLLGRWLGEKLAETVRSPRPPGVDLGATGEGTQMRIVGDNIKIRLEKGMDLLTIHDSGWLSLGHLRALVTEADNRGWPDNSLVSHSAGGIHPFRNDIKPAYRIAIEGNVPE